MEIIKCHCMKIRQEYITRDHVSNITMATPKTKNLTPLSTNSSDNDKSAYRQRICLLDYMPKDNIGRLHLEEM